MRRRRSATHTGRGWTGCPACRRVADAGPGFADTLTAAGAAAPQVTVAVVAYEPFDCVEGLGAGSVCRLVEQLEQAAGGQQWHRLPGERLALVTARAPGEVGPGLHEVAARANRTLPGGTVTVGLAADGDPATALEHADAMARAVARRTVARPAPLRHAEAAAVRALVSGASAVAVAYQPVVELASGAVLGYEALMRPRGGSLESPTTAFAVAGRIGLAAALDAVCRDAVLADAPGLDMRREEVLFVNVDPHTVVHPSFDAAELGVAVHGAGLTPARVVLEVCDNPDVAPHELAAGVERARAAGFLVGLDDVGDPSCRLETLRRCPADYLKLDETLTAAAAADPRSLAAFRSLCAFANQVGSTVVVEGVEDEALHGLALALDGHRLDPLRAEVAQGYHLGRPGPRPRQGADSPSTTGEGS